MRIKHLLITDLTLAALCPALPAYAAGRAPVWEVVELRDPKPDSAQRAEGPEVEIREKYVYISTEHAETVRVYTILGQLVTQKEIQPGTIRLQLPTRGVYILKTDTATLRINL